MTFADAVRAFVRSYPFAKAREVVPISIEFGVPKKAEREGEQIIVEDLGAPADRGHQNVRRDFWRGGR